MKLKLTRKTYTTRSTIGDLEVDGKFQCYVLEDPVRPVKIKGITAIPSGTYNVVITRSEKFKRDMPLLDDVPNYEGVRIHPGNTPENTEGCLLVGKTKATDSIGTSQDAFHALFDLLKAELDRGGHVTIEIIEGGVSPFMAKEVAQPQRNKGGIMRVTADPLRLRSSGDASQDNVIARLPFGLLITGTGREAPAGWVEVDAVVDSQALRGFVSTSFVETLPATATSTAKPKTRSKGTRSAKDTATAPTLAADALFRVNSDTLNLRTDPAVLTDESIIASLPHNQLVRKVRASSKAMWWEVETVVHGETRTGFIHSGFLVPDQAGTPATIPSATPTTGGVQVSERALQLILDFEGMDQPASWPGQQSGISLGHGYDLGYHTFDEFRGDWGPYLSEDQLKRLSRAIGKRGTAAANIASDFSDIRITKAAADAVFMNSTVPKIKLWALKSFPGILALPSDAQGALTSLVYNRGTDMEGDRRREMREIRDTTGNGSLSINEKLRSIAASLRSMKRIWPSNDPKSGHPGIRRRREAEAALVESAG